MSNRIQETSYDVIVVGARCVGAATAMLLARSGLRVLAVDRERYGSDTLSTHALMRSGVLQLHRWGVLDAVREAGTTLIQKTSFHYGSDVVEIKIKPRHGIDGLYAPRRSLIDRILVDAARESGVEVVHETRVVDLLRAEDGRVIGVVAKDAEGKIHEIAARLVVGADGMRSTVAKLAEAKTNLEGRHATGVIFSYWKGTGFDQYHWYYQEGRAAGVIPSNDGQVCVFISVPAQRFRDEVRHDMAAGHDQIMEECDPELAQMVRGAEQVQKHRGYPGYPGFFRQCWGPGWALVGDAGYFKDPLTAHGMTDGLIDAELVARAAVADTEEAFAEYQRTRDDRGHKLFEVTEAIASFEWNLDEIRELHVSLNQEMKRETQALTDAMSS